MTDNQTNKLEVKVATASRGANWLFDGFGYFKKDWLAWLGVTIIFFIMTIAISLIPLGNLVFNMFVPAFFAGLMLGCREQEQGGAFGISHLFAAFSENLSQYLLLGVLYMLGILAVMLLVFILMLVMLGGMEFIADLQAGKVEGFMNALLAILIGSLFYLPLLMAMWFAPALIAFDKLSAIEAMKNSFKGCWVNVVPYLLYGLVGLVLTIIASIPLGLGWLVLFPMITASIYVAYKDIFQPISE